ncbi:MAG: alpha-hydroxy-acid oxidizing protein [Alphaproteobacteria bacterium]|nr:alpha-hydroxy-acid oxidizing protein [Alphaproteobacteria bacterium]
MSSTTDERRRMDLDAWERDAIAALPAMVADYYAGGARSEGTLRANRSGWSRHALVHRILAGVREVRTAASFAGVRVAAPIVAAPTAFHRLAHPDGEVATARGVAAAGSAMVLSTLSTAAVEEVAAAAPGRVAFQLYVYRDRGATRALVERVRAAGCRALVLTADAAILGTRFRDVRNGFHLPPGLSLPNAAPEGRTMDGDGSGSVLARYVADQLDPSLGWGDLEAFLADAGLPVWIKGVVHPEDAARAAAMGVAGIVVSNHGGRQLDAGIATADALPRVVDAVAGRCPVWVDGGVRRGTDVCVALALGADGVLLGRPVLWGLALEGADGVRQVLELLRAELVEALTLIGVSDHRTLDRGCLG